MLVASSVSFLVMVAICTCGACSYRKKRRRSDLLRRIAQYSKIDRC